MPNHIEGCHEGKQLIHHNIMLHALSHDLCTGPCSNAKETILFALSECDGPDTDINGGDAGVAN